MLGKPFSSFESGYKVSPRIVHMEQPDHLVNELSTFVGVAKTEQHASPYCCPYHGVNYCPKNAVLYVKSRADLPEFLGKLSGRTLICNCSQPSNKCWANILVNEFAVVFPGVPNDVSQGSGSGGVGAPSSATECPYEDSLASSASSRTTSGRSFPSDSFWTGCGSSSLSPSPSAGCRTGEVEVFPGFGFDRCSDGRGLPSGSSWTEGGNSRGSVGPSVPDRTGPLPPSASGGTGVVDLG